MKKKLKKFLSRIYKINRKYGDAPKIEIKEAKKYKNIKKL